MSPTIRSSYSYNNLILRRSFLSELSGSLGDLGTLLPLLIALTLTNSISLSSTLVFTGLSNILTGVCFGIPLPVQPMKAIAAVAISQNFTKGETASAGLLVAGFIFIVSVSGLLRWFSRVIPIPVVKGIQVGAGLSLVISAGATLKPLSWVHPWEDNYIWMIFAFLLLCASSQLPRFPYALFIFLLGILFSATITSRSHFPGFELWHPFTLIPTPREFKTGALLAGIGQIPLTTLNSVIAVEHLARDLLPDRPSPGITSLGLSVALMNLVSCWFGSMPVCHGSGGLAAQYRFGARSGSSIIMLGALKLFLGLFFGDSLVHLLQRFPRALLGVMVLAAGLELAKVGESLNMGARDLWVAAEEESEGVTRNKSRELNEEERMRRWTVMFTTVGALLAFKNDAVGFLAGMLAHWTFWASDLIVEKRRAKALREREGTEEGRGLLSHS
jgi:Molybdate transporter of MFS superfamily